MISMVVWLLQEVTLLEIVHRLTSLPGADLEIVGRGFLTTASGLLISQLSLMVTISFYHPLI